LQKETSITYEISLNSHTNSLVMNTETRKSNLIQWLSNLNDEATIKKLENIQKDNKDWYDELSTSDKGYYEKGIELHRSEV